jgi:hypothetical protein
MTTELRPGDRVRVKPLGASGVILRVSTKLRVAPYLVEVQGYGERSYGAEDLQKLVGAVPSAAPVQAVRVGSVLKCGSCGSLNLSGTHCRQCNTPWRTP